MAKIGFAALKGKLEREGKSSEAAGSIAYAVGKKKYGAKGMQRKAKAGMLKAKKAQ